MIEIFRRDAFATLKPGMSVIAEGRRWVWLDMRAGDRVQLRCELTGERAWLATSAVEIATAHWDLNHPVVKEAGRSRADVRHHFAKKSKR
ncbi:hypothetical protein [Bradyrhizobium sp. CCBAU 051011]|uniref:hypothetical protein n=1 Tax=Bradyrhizobium sp. CCBAU 051011 TaxID=858422 RepID=UPI00137A0F7E|nr:hypothetical protein [Bradyrhizobium sp. CCBAU 051011]